MFVLVFFEFLRISIPKLPYIQKLAEKYLKNQVTKLNYFITKKTIKYEIDQNNIKNTNEKEQSKRKNQDGKQTYVDPIFGETICH